MSWTLTRRDLLKAGFTTAAVGATGVPLSALGAEEPKDWRWDRGVCRFCGVGCGIQVATAGGRVVAVKGDPASPVNRGLLCVKGYALPEIQYGADRLTRPLLRMRNGRFDKKGDFVAVTWTEAFDVMEREWKRVHRELGPTGVAIMGSGQYTIPEGYAALKLMKAGFRSNNLDPNARHCMASAVAGFMRTFGIDEPMGCYDDIEQADAFVLWGSNMAEMHPILWSRITDRRLTHPNCKVAVLSTFEHRSFDLADIPMVFTPQTDLAMLNFICHHIISTGKVNTDFVKKHVNFKKSATDIGYGLRPGHDLEKNATSNGYPGADGKPKGDTGKSDAITFEEFANFVSEYTVEKVSKLSGVAEKDLKALAEIYADPKV